MAEVKFRRLEMLFFTNIYFALPNTNIYEFLFSVITILKAQARGKLSTDKNEAFN